MTPNDYPIAIIGDGQITASSGSRPYPTGDILNVTGLATIALAKADGQRAMWIAPGSDLAAKATQAKFWKEFELGPDTPHWKVFPVGVQGGIPSAAAVRRDKVSGEARREVMIYGDVGGRWGLPLPPGGILRAVTTYERLLGTQVRLSPANTALEVLRLTNDTEDRRPWIAPLAEEHLAAIPWPTQIAPLHVNHQPSDGAWVHLWDKNAAFLAACKVPLGSGEPVYCDRPGGELLEAILSGKAYGLWNVTTTPPADLDRALPSPWGEMWPAGDWFYTPHIHLAVQLGWSVVVHEGYHWPARHQIFGDYAARMWHARLEARAAGGSYTEALIKRSVSQAWGIIARQLDDGQKVHWYNRPDWGGTITAEHHLRQVKQIHALHARQGGYLFARTDMVAVVSPYPDPLASHPTPQQRPNMLGGYKHVGAIGGAAARDLIALARSGATLEEMLGATKQAMEAPSGDVQHALR